MKKGVIANPYCFQLVKKMKSFFWCTCNTTLNHRPTQIKHIKTRICLQIKRGIIANSPNLTFQTFHSLFFLKNIDFDILSQQLHFDMILLQKSKLVFNK